MSYNPSCYQGRMLKVWQQIEDASLIVLAKNKEKFFTGEGLDHGKVGTRLNAAGLSYTLLPWLPLLLCSVKYEKEETVQHQQAKELSRECKICCLSEVVLGCYDCCGCITVIYRNISLLKQGNTENDKQWLGPCCGFGTCSCRIQWFIVCPGENQSGMFLFRDRIIMKVIIAECLSEMFQTSRVSCQLPC